MLSDACCRRSDKHSLSAHLLEFHSFVVNRAWMQLLRQHGDCHPDLSTGHKLGRTQTCCSDRGGSVAHQSEVRIRVKQDSISCGNSPFCRPISLWIVGAGCYMSKFIRFAELLELC